MSLTNTYPLGTIEFQPLDVQVDNQAITDYLTTITPYSEQPTTWTPAYTLDGQHGLMINATTRGLFTVWARIIDNPENVIVIVGYIQVV